MAPRNDDARQSRDARKAGQPCRPARRDDTRRPKLTLRGRECHPNAATLPCVCTSHVRATNMLAEVIATLLERSRDRRSWQLATTINEAHSSAAVVTQLLISFCVASRTTTPSRLHLFSIDSRHMSGWRVHGFTRDLNRRTRIVNCTPPPP